MTLDEVIDALIQACRDASVDAERVFDHLDKQDVTAYGQAIEKGWLTPTLLAQVVGGIPAERCLCRRCKATRKGLE